MSLNPTTRILCAIPSTEPGTFQEVLRALGDDSPPDGIPWRQFFLTLESFEASQLVEIDRGPGNRINSIQLTALGAERAREAQQQAER